MNLRRLFWRLFRPLRCYIYISVPCFNGLLDWADDRATAIWLAKKAWASGKYDAIEVLREHRWKCDQSVKVWARKKAVLGRSNND